MYTRHSSHASRVHWLSLSALPTASPPAQSTDRPSVRPSARPTVRTSDHPSNRPTARPPDCPGRSPKHLTLSKCEPGSTFAQYVAVCCQLFCVPLQTICNSPNDAMIFP